MREHNKLFEHVPIIRSRTELSAVTVGVMKVIGVACALAD